MSIYLKENDSLYISVTTYDNIIDVFTNKDHFKPSYHVLMATKLMRNGETTNKFKTITQTCHLSYE